MTTRQKTIDVLTEVEFDALLNGRYDRDEGEVFGGITSTRDRAIVAVLAGSGVRVRELAALTPQDIRRNGTTQLHVKRGKGGKPRTTMLLNDAMPYLEAWLAERTGPDTAPLFMTNTGRPVAQQYIDRMLKRAAAAAGITKRVHAHAMRHRFTTVRWLEGCELGVLQILLGHESPMTTVRYIHSLGLGIAPERLAKLAAGSL